MDEGKLCKVADPDFGKRLTSREPDALLDEKLFGHQVEYVGTYVIEFVRSDAPSNYERRS